LTYEYDPEKRKKLYHQFNAIIHQEAPYTFLYVPRLTLLYREYLQNVFLPIDRQDILPGANVAEPEPTIFWIKAR
jgi:peptide/nickel transport system substrate-binding protein